MVTREEALKDWLAALRSKNYHQANGALRDGDGYCCLGLFCEIVRTHVDGVWSNSEDSAGNSYFLMPNSPAHLSALPFFLQDLLGFESDIGTFEITDDLLAKFPRLQESKDRHQSCVSSLTSLNDKFGWSFEEIADLIEACPKGLFKAGL